MTITFSYFQYLHLFSLLYIVLPLIISANFAIIISIFLFRVHKNRGNNVHDSRLLMVAGIIIIIFSLLPLVIPAVQGSSMTELETFILISYILLSGLIASLPFFIAYGVFFYIFGKRNKSKFNVNFLMIAGILWMISYGFNIIGFNGGILSALSLLGGFTGSEYIIYAIFTILGFIFFIVQLNGFILVLIHGIKYSDKNFMVVGILGLVLFITNFIYRIYLVYNPLSILI